MTKATREALAAVYGTLLKAGWDRPTEESAGAPPAGVAGADRGLPAAHAARPDDADPAVDTAKGEIKTPPAELESREPEQVDTAGGRIYEVTLALDGARFVGRPTAPGRILTQTDLMARVEQFVTGHGIRMTDCSVSGSVIAPEPPYFVRPAPETRVKIRFRSSGPKLLDLLSELHEQESILAVHAIRLRGTAKEVPPPSIHIGQVTGPVASTGEVTVAVEVADPDGPRIEEKACRVASPAAPREWPYLPPRIGDRVLVAALPADDQGRQELIVLGAVAKPGGEGVAELADALNRLVTPRPLGHKPSMQAGWEPLGTALNTAEAVLRLLVNVKPQSLSPEEIATGLDLPIGVVTNNLIFLTGVGRVTKAPNGRFAAVPAPHDAPVREPGAPPALR